MFVLECQAFSYPLNILNIITQKGWIISSYQSAGLPVIRECEARLALGHVFIFYDANVGKQRNRFNICHEIGHIVLIHFNFANPEVYEREAKMFSARILMPIALLYKYNLNTAEKIARACDVSIEAAEWRLKRFNELKARNKFLTNDLEKLIYQQLRIKND